MTAATLPRSADVVVVGSGITGAATAAVFVRRAERGGVRLAYSTKATRVVVARGRVKRVETTRGVIAADRVVVGAGVWTAHLVVSAGLGARVTRRASLYDLGDLRLWLPRARTFRKHLRIRPDARQVLRELRNRSALGSALVPDTSPEPFCDKRSVDRALARLGQVLPTAAGAAARRYWAGLVHRDVLPGPLPQRGRVPRVMI